MSSGKNNSSQRKEKRMRKKMNINSKTAYINQEGYVERVARCRKPGISKPTKRKWYFVKYAGGSLVIQIGTTGIIRMPKEFEGKRVRLKIEVVKDGNKTNKRNLQA